MSSPRLTAVAACVLLGAACASKQKVEGTAEGAPGASGGAPAPGMVWDVAAKQWTDLAAVKAAAVASRFVILGETHDNPAHHQLQAQVLDAVLSAKAPAVGFEMLDSPRQPEVDAAVTSARGDPDAFGEDVRWAQSGWPAFEVYRPVFAETLEAGVPILAVNLSREEARGVVKNGPIALNQDARALLMSLPALPEAALESYRAEMRDSHCGALPENLIDPMVLAQRARDVELARRLSAGATQDGAVLITGSGHARLDRGVPWVLENVDAGARVMSLAILEVEADAEGLDDYAKDWGGTLPFDYVAFTKAHPRPDPCAKLRAR